MRRVREWGWGRRMCEQACGCRAAWGEAARGSAHAASGGGGTVSMAAFVRWGATGSHGARARQLRMRGRHSTAVREARRGRARVGLAVSPRAARGLAPGPRAHLLSVCVRKPLGCAAPGLSGAAWETAAAAAPAAVAARRAAPPPPGRLAPRAPEPPPRPARRHAAGSQSQTRGCCWCWQSERTGCNPSSPGPPGRRAAGIARMLARVLAPFYIHAGLATPSGLRNTDG